MICPNCHNHSFKESRQCPLYDSEPVCITCCYKCKYYSQEGLPCRYYIENPRTDHTEELKKLKQKIAMKELQVERFYKNNKPWIANRIEGELHLLYGDRKELEKKIANSNHT